LYHGLPGLSNLLGLSCAPPDGQGQAVHTPPAVVTCPLTAKYNEGGGQPLPRALDGTPLGMGGWHGFWGIGAIQQWIRERRRYDEVAGVLADESVELRGELEPA